MIFTRYGTGHAAMRLSDALTESCNVYFFHEAAEAGPAPLVDWAGGSASAGLRGSTCPTKQPGIYRRPARK